MIVTVPFLFFCLFLIVHSSFSKMKKTLPTCLWENNWYSLQIVFGAERIKFNWIIQTSLTWNWPKWVVPENIRTPTTGGIEILPPHAFENSKMLHPPHIRNSRLLYPPSLSVFSTPSEFPIQSTTPPQKSFFRPLKKMLCTVFTHV